MNALPTAPVEVPATAPPGAPTTATAAPAVAAEVAQLDLIARKLIRRLPEALRARLTEFCATGAASRVDRLCEVLRAGLDALQPLQSATAARPWDFPDEAWAVLSEAERGHVARLSDAKSRLDITIADIASRRCSVDDVTHNQWLNAVRDDAVAHRATVVDELRAWGGRR